MPPLLPVNILLVDDQPAKLLSYEIILRDLGENLIKASSGREALEKILRNEIAVILIDVCMPDLDGFELAQMIQEHPRFGTTSIIFVSAISVTDLDRLKGYQHGAVDYIPVPVVPDLLRARVRVFAELYRKTKALEQLNLELERRVAERTADLADINQQLEQRVEERTREREAALAQLHEMQKMESLGQLTGGLAHDFNNLLMGVLGSLNVLAKGVEKGSKAERFLVAARESAERGAALTHRLLAFARRQELHLENVYLDQLIIGLVDMLQRSVGPGIHIRLDLAPDLRPIRADSNQIELALLNLTLNARDAMADGGTLMIRTSADLVSESGMNLRAGDYVRVTLTDSGQGMDEATLKRCTEPFFTTKERGKGTGLGLSSVHGMTIQSGGSMQVASSPGAGTTVTMWLPVSKVADLGGERLVLAVDTSAERILKVLVIDDEPLVGSVTVSMLEEIGHTATWVSSAEEALVLLQSDRVVDVALTDHAMPGMSGSVFAEEARRLRPTLPIVLATGFADVPGVLAQTLPRLAKPYGPGELSNILAGIMNQPLAS